ncbi:hypothetical protein TNIN_280231 [Trichonephila inaurata madagascariensis]|uniref:Uncharacterized protein n=1 Tax=Trichonephila inaurata madagascariensis TaxID=2747483 RepID=A0A8X6XDZ7_9ARAC|nr:hypothetical protein TNIN_280231 [Trichonephila inaurata madagascariensis]
MVKTNNSRIPKTAGKFCQNFSLDTPLDLCPSVHFPSTNGCHHRCDPKTVTMVMDDGPTLEADVLAMHVMRLWRPPS